MNSREKLKKARRLVVKVGTSTLTHPNGLLNIGRIEKIVQEIADLHHAGKDLILVTSGAVGAGMGRLGFSRKVQNTTEKQAAAAVGQGVLMHIYEKMFSEFGINVAQVLLTRSDIEDERRHQNARETLNLLWKWKVVPIINENDTVAAEEIRFGDNDTLSALVSEVVGADLLILLTDTDGLFDRDPSEPGAKLITYLTEITPDTEQLARGSNGVFSTGGMVTKVLAMKIAGEASIPVVIANAGRPGVLQSLCAGEEIGTFFDPEGRQEHGKDA